MKKNRMMRLASLVLVMTMITTSAVSSTFAKYVTQDDASDVARVAKWGVELQAIGNLYGDTYKNAIVADDDDSLTVQAVDFASNETDVVAPGTENNNGFTFSLKGKPEVAGKITSEMIIQNIFLMKNTYGIMIPVDSTTVTEATFDEFVDSDGNGLLYVKNGAKYELAENFSDKADGDFFYTLEDEVTLSDDYYPVVYKLAGNTNTDAAPPDDTVDSLEKVADLIAAQLGMTTKVDNRNNTDTSSDPVYTYSGEVEFDANTVLDTEYLVDGLTLTWAWAFELGDDDDEKAENNGADTILGLLQTADLNEENVGLVVEGEVVMLDTEANDGTYKMPVEYTDYCLDTQFSLDITVEQVD